MANPNPQNPGDPNKPERETEPDDRPDSTYEPSTVQVNRGREHGLGMGQKDLDYQRDATRAPSSQQYSREPDGGGSRGQG